MYAARLERDLLRTGFRTWRYNDDVRIACLSYEEALEAIEAFDHSARKIGLIANENKTVIVGFVRYTSDAYGLEISDAETIHRDEVEIALGDYAVGFMKEPAKALAFVRSTGVSGAYDVDLRNVKSDDVRKLRRAIGGLASAAHPGGLEYMPMLLRYVPSLTPSVMKYVESVHDAIPEAAEEVLDEFRRGVSKSAWQRMWLVHTLGQVGALQDPERSQWVRSQLESAMSAPLRATCVLALAASGALSLRDVLDHANAAPPALLPFYASAVAGAVRARGGEMPPEATAFKDASLLHRALVSDPIS
ncbi:Uncharacterised protein [Mycobacteroides abscessus]|nr:Uncharacterised protein [Mycobacteroides abscessus]